MDVKTLGNLLHEFDVDQWGCKFDGKTIIDPEDDTCDADELLGVIAQIKSQCEQLEKLIAWAKSCPKVNPE